ncbi:MAG TPA: deoxyribonuclease IV [Vicinamibacterales bacterium]|nr:deoxyribonuclease IV [Vicinamibacterales bacterium]
MPRIGAHMSIGGGLPRAVDRAALHGCEALQIFTKSAGQWRARPLPPDEVRAFRRRVEETGITPVVAHASYLINLATRDGTLRAQSMTSLAEELDRAEALGLAGVVLHPGACTAGEDDGGLQLIAQSLRSVLGVKPRARVRVLLEHTAGQGTVLGHTFEQLARIIELTDGSPRVGVWLDTCHLLAAGYDIATDSGYADVFAWFSQVIGLERLKGFHLNDSKTALGSRIDRHEHIGHGHLGLDTFRRVLNDPRFASLPMLIETAKTEHGSRTNVTLDRLDVRNLSALRALLT